MSTRQIAGRGGRRRAQAVARRFRARLPVRRRRRPDDRRAQGLAARGRLRRGRRCISAPTPSRWRRSPTRQLSGRRRLGGGDARGRRVIRDAQDRTVERRGRQIDRLGHAGRQGQSQPLHGQGNPRAAGSGRPYAGALHRHGDRARRAAGQAAVRLGEARSGCRSRPAAPPFMPGWWRNTGSSASPSCRSKSISPPNSATATRRSKPGDLAIFISQSGETADTLATLRYAQGAQAAHSVGRECADLDHRARKRRRDADAGRAGDRRRLDQGLHLPARGAGLPGDRRRPRARRALRGRRAEAGARADRGAAPDDARR